MKALNAASLTPLSVLCDSRTEHDKKFKFTPLPTTFPIIKFKNFATKTQDLNQYLSSKSLHGGLMLASSLLGGDELAQALTYEEALEQSVSASSIPEVPELPDVSGSLDTLISYATENPVIVAGGAAVLVVPLIVSQLFKGSKPYGVESAKAAYNKLGDEPNAQLLDIRAPVEIKKVGTPDIRGLGKKPVSVAYKSGDKNGFLKKLSLKFKQPENTTLFVLDKFNGNSELVAELGALNGFKAAYAIKDGAEGPKGWRNSGLPWTEPKKGLSFDFGSLTESFTGALEGADGLSVALGVAVAAGAGLLAFSEIETLLQVFGSVALIQFASKKLLFAEDRKKTLKQVDEFLNTKIAPRELADEIKEIGKALLPTPITSKALPSPAPESPEPPPATLQAEAPPQINSVPAAEVKAESPPSTPTPPRPLSPYPAYPDFKPPTSPTPSQP